MVLTKKFSAFTSITPATINDANEKMVGLDNGVNMQSTRYFTWSTAGRPPTPFNGLFGLNTTLEKYEFWDSLSSTWNQFTDSTDIAALIARLAAHTAGNGASMIGLLNQSNVTNKTVQDLANATFIAKTNNGTLQNAQFLGSLTTGIVKNTTVTGVLSISTPLTQIDNLSPVQGDILYHNGSAWVILPPSTPNFILSTQGPGANPQWIFDVGTGTVTSISAGTGITLTPDPIITTGTVALTIPVAVTSGGTGLTSAENSSVFITNAAGVPAWSGALTNGQLIIGSTGATPVVASLSAGSGVTITPGAGTITIAATGSGGTVTSLTSGSGITLTPSPITSTGSIALTAIADHTVLANISGGSLAPSSTTLTALIDNAIGSTQGDILYRNASAWVVLAPGTNGQFLQTQGAAANVQWASGASGTVTSFSAGTLSPLFTTSVATATTTPVLSFILTNAGANTYFGNATGGSGAPSYTTAGALTKTDDTNVTLTLGGSPTVALLAAASLTLGWSGQLAITRGGTGVSSVTTSPTASAWAGWDVNKNLSAINFLPGYTTTVTAAATTTLTVGSTYNQFFTGSTTQTLTMPVVSTLVLGQTYYLVNSSSGNITVQSSGGNTILTMTQDTEAYITCISTSGTGVASWYFSFLNKVESVGTVTSVSTNNGLTGGPITTTGTIGLANIADHTLLANISGGSTFPSSTTLTALIDNAIGSTQGNILYRNNTAWVVLAPGTSGQFLQTAGAAANPLWASAGAGSVTSVSVVSANNFSGTVATATTTPAITIGANTNQFSAAPSTVSNVTGDGTVYTIILNNADYNPGSILNTGTGVWTLATTGMYTLSGAIALSGIGVAHTSCVITMAGASGAHVSGSLIDINPFAISDSGVLIIPISYNYIGTNADTNSITVKVSGSTKTVNVTNLTNVGLSLMR